MAQGNCRSYPPATFFPSDGVGVDRARRICANCPVTEPCLEYALEHRIDHGVWGGAGAERTPHPEASPAQPARQLSSRFDERGSARHPAHRHDTRVTTRHHPPVPGRFAPLDATRPRRGPSTGTRRYGKPGRAAGPG
ncbi:MAG: WhiB family transcriptional regulator [Ilumatobacteraceae bacterium]